MLPGDDLNATGPEILATRSVFYPDTEEMMGWKVTEKGFRITLSPEVPVLIREHLGHDVDAFLADHGHKRSDIGSWVLHTGGPKVLEATADALDLHDGQLDASWDCLKKVGNLSSASVLVVLEDVMKNRRPEPGTLGMLAAMGPGFCSELATSAVVRYESVAELDRCFRDWRRAAGLAAAIAARQRGIPRDWWPTARSRRSTRPAAKA